MLYQKNRNTISLSKQPPETRDNVWVQSHYTSLEAHIMQTWEMESLLKVVT